MAALGGCHGGLKVHLNPSHQGPFETSSFLLRALAARRISQEQEVRQRARLTGTFFSRISVTLGCSFARECGLWPGLLLADTLQWCHAPSCWLRPLPPYKLVCPSPNHREVFLKTFLSGLAFTVSSRDTHLH